MAQYTFTVYELMRNGFDFGMKDYPIFDEEYREILNNTILDYYKFREIAYSLPELWKDRLNVKLDRIMRNKYNELYRVKQQQFNPLYNVEMHETFTRTAETDDNIESVETSIGETTSLSNATATGNTTGTSNVVNDSKIATSQYPSQKMIEGDMSEDIYVDNASNSNVAENTTSENITENTSEDNSTFSGNSTTNNSGKAKSLNVESYERHTEGSSAGLPFSKAMLQFKDYIQKYRLDEQVIEDLSDLFINVY